jgi:carboxymethylenebutenolidase
MRRFRRIESDTTERPPPSAVRPTEDRYMCHDHDSHPPIVPIAGGALDGERVELTASDGNRLTAFRARPTQPRGAGVVILPDVRGLHPFYEELALRFAEHGVDAIAIDWFGRTAGVGRRGEDFEHMPHVQRTTWDGNATDIRAGVEALRADGIRSIFTIGFCMGGRMSFLASTLDLDLAGVIGLYGTLQGPWRNDAPAPLDRLDDIGSPILALFGGADPSITADAVEAFDRGLAARGVDHRVVTYPEAPHSFFDRKAADFARESAAAWGEVLAFIDAHSSGETERRRGLALRERPGSRD